MPSNLLFIQQLLMSTYIIAWNNATVFTHLGCMVNQCKVISVLSIEFMYSNCSRQESFYLFINFFPLTKEKTSVGIRRP